MECGGPHAGRTPRVKGILNKGNSFGIRQALAVALCVAVGLPLLLLAWSKIAQLLNSRSDAGVLLGLSVLLVTLVLVGIIVFLLLRKLSDGWRIKQGRDEEQHTLAGTIEPKSLFSESVNSVENLYEDRRTKNKRE